MAHIRQKYDVTTHPHIRSSWDNWYNCIAPLVDEDVYQYERRMSRNLNAIHIPLREMIFKKTSVNNSTNWVIDHLMNEKLDPTFEWPEPLQAAMNSVASRYNPNPRMPRLDAANDTELIALIDHFKGKVDSFYKLMSEKTNKFLEIMAHRRVLYSCAVASTAGDKAQLIEKTETWGRYFMTTIFRPPNAMSMNVLNHHFNYVYSSIDDSRHVLAKVSHIRFIIT